MAKSAHWVLTGRQGGLDWSQWSESVRVLNNLHVKVSRVTKNHDLFSLNFKIRIYIKIQKKYDEIILPNSKRFALPDKMTDKNDIAKN